MNYRPFPRPKCPEGLCIFYSFPLPRVNVQTTYRFQSFLSQYVSLLDTKSPGAGRTPSVKPCGFATFLSEGGNPLRHRCAMPPPPKGGGLLHLTGRRKAPFLRDDFPRPGENVAQRQKGESGTPQATGGVCPQTQKSPAERVLCGAGMQVLRRYAYSLTTKRTRVYSFCLVTVTPNLVGL